MFTSDSAPDVPIPDVAGRPESTMTFGVLKAAQALGDMQALREGGRKVIRFHLKGDISVGLASLLKAFS